MSRMMVVAACLAVVGCRTGAAVPEAAREATIRVLATVPITYDAGGHHLPVPMIAITVAGQKTQLIVDTGASHHVLTKELAQKASLAMKAASESAKDHVGGEVNTWEIGNVAVQVGEAQLALAEVAAVPGPPPFEPLGIGGFLSPQHMHPTAHAVLDFESSQLLLVDGSEDAIAAWADARWKHLAAMKLPRANTDRKIMVEASLEPFSPVVTELDSGGSGTEFLAAYVSDAQEENASDNGVGIGGGTVEGVTVKNRILRIGGHALPVEKLLARKDMASPLFKGLVGMDLLRGTVLAVSPRQQDAVLWLVSEKDALKKPQ